MFFFFPIRLKSGLGQEHVPVFSKSRRQDVSCLIPWAKVNNIEYYQLVLSLKYHHETGYPSSFANSYSELLRCSLSTENTSDRRVVQAATMSSFFVSPKTRLKYLNCGVPINSYNYYSTSSIPASHLHPQKEGVD